MKGIKYDITHPIYKTYHAMIQRCYNKNVVAYKYYGANGIIVCEEWRNNFIDFCVWAIESGWKNSLELDRVNSYGDYEPDNCRWSTDLIQARNRTNNRFYSKNGTIKTVAEWAEEFGMKWNDAFKHIKANKQAYTKVNYLNSIKHKNTRIITCNFIRKNGKRCRIIPFPKADKCYLHS